MTTQPTPVTAARGHAQQVLRTKLAADALKLRTMAEVRQIVYSAGPDTVTETPED